MPNPRQDKLKDQLDRTRKVAEQATIALTGELKYLGETAEKAIQAASNCNLEQMARALLYTGMAEFTIAGHADRYIEDTATRAAFHEERVKMSTLTEELIAEALEENCHCARNLNPLNMDPSPGERKTHELTHHMTAGICDTPGCYMGHRLAK